MNVLGWMLQNVPVQFLVPGVGFNGSYTVSGQAPRILFNSSPTVSALQAQKTSSSAPYVRFKNMVDAELATPGTNYLFQAYFASMMYMMTGTTSYANYAYNLVMSTLTSEENLINSGQNPTIAGDDYLDIGQILGDMMMTLDWCRFKFSSNDISRILTYANQAVYNLWNPNSAAWGSRSAPWVGWAIDDPGDNYYYSFLAATMFTGLATYGDQPVQAQQWLTQFQSKITELNTVFASQQAGGGSREGTGYGLSIRSLFRLYYYWVVSTGQNIADITSHSLRTSYWFIHTLSPDCNYQTATGDQSRDSTAAFYDYQREYLESCLVIHQNDIGAQIAGKTITTINNYAMVSSFNYVADFLYYLPSISTPADRSALNTTFYDQYTGVFSTRSDWTTTATWIYQIAGPYTQSHAHRDQGSFVVWNKGWLFDDECIRTNSGILQDEYLHNLVRFINAGTVVPIQYNTTATMVALDTNANWAYSCCDTLPSYGGAAQVVKSQRELLFIKPNCIVVFDRATASDSTTSRVYTLNMSTAPTISGNKISLVKGSSTADCWMLSASGSWSNVTYSGGDFISGNRSEFTDSTGASSLFLSVIGVNSDVASVTSNNTGSTTGANITFTDGRTATVQFSNASTGGTLLLKSSSGTTVFNGALTSTVVQPSLLSS